MTYRDLVVDVVREDQPESQAQRWDAEPFHMLWWCGQWWGMWLLSVNIMSAYSVQSYNSHIKCNFWMLSHICALYNPSVAILHQVPFTLPTLTLWTKLTTLYFFFLLLRAPRAMMDLPALQERGLVSNDFWSVPPEMLQFCAACSTSTSGPPGLNI